MDTLKMSGSGACTAPGLGYTLLLLFVVLATAVRPARAAPKPVDGPVAVLPFKNLNDDPDLDWLAVGMGETMVSDLKQSGKVQVVERDQIDKAMAQIALQQSGQVAADTAVKVGKLVGAKTIVVGAYQEAGKQLRITARFVRVETGEVLDAAKVTGPETRIFHLQDAIVGRLLGYRRARDYRPPHQRSATTKTVKAYKLYAMAMSIASDATRVRYLQRAVKIDPTFVYASDELTALEQRMVGYHEEHEIRTEDRRAKERRELFATLADPTQASNPLTITKVVTVIAYDQSSFEETQLLSDMDRIEKLYPSLKWPQVDLAPTFLYYRILANWMLKRIDRALQYGEAFMKRYPDSNMFPQAENMMHSMIAERRRVEDGAKKLDQDLARADKRVADAKVRVGRYHLDSREIIQAELARCETYNRDDQYVAGLEECRKFIRAHANDPLARGYVYQATNIEIILLRNLGRFDEVRTTVQAAMKANPDKVKDLKEWLENLPR